MLLLVGAVLTAGAVVGFARGGRLNGLATVRFRWSLLVLAALVGQLSLGRVPSGWRLAVVLATYAVVGVWIAGNVRHLARPLSAAVGVVAAGWALNVAAIVPHGGMPVSTEALRALGVPAGHDVAAGHLYKHVNGDSAAAVGRWLGDVIPVPPLGAVISVGDILLAAGIATFVAAAMGRRASSAPIERAPAGAR